MLFKVRNLEDPSECFVYYGHNNPVTVAKFSPSGFWVASADDTGKVRVWAWDNPEHSLKVEVAAFSGKIIDLDWDPESKRIVVVGDGKQLSAKCFMWDTGNSVGEMIGHAKRITTVSYKPSRPFRIMTGGEDCKTCWYTGPPFKIDHTNADHAKEVWCVRFSPDGHRLASVGADRKIVFYDAKEGTKTAEVAEGGAADNGAHAAAILHCCWSPDSAQLATCSLDKTVKVWDAATGACVTTFTFGGAPTLADMQCAVAW
jgi:WD40 repeat protein